MMKSKNTLSYRLCNLFVAVSFLTSMCVLPSNANAQSVLNLPAPGMMVTMSSPYTPIIVSGITIYPENPLQFDFIIDAGDDNYQGEELREESKKLINYFLATLTVPEDEMWVNLSPYEKDRIIADGIGITEMGRDMLAQDYLLKQLTASLMYPEDEIGSEFWKKVYEKAQARFGTTEIPTDTFNKIWIVPENAVVYVSGNNVFVSQSHLKVMLEEDYLALESNIGSAKHGLGNMTKNEVGQISAEAKEIIREVMIPEIEREVNEGKNFANLRQIYNSMILATWYKKNLKDGVLGSIYMDLNKVQGIDLEDKQIKGKIYNQYVDAFKKGVYNYIKEDYDPATQKIIPRKYFSGGVVGHTKDTVVNGDESARESVEESFADENPEYSTRVELDMTNESGEIIRVSSPVMTSDSDDQAKKASGIAEAVEQARQAVEIMSDAERKSIVVDGVGRQIREHFDGEQTDIFHLVGRMEDYFQEAFGISIFGRGVSNDEAGMEVTDNGQVFKWFGVETSNATSGQRVILDENLPQLVDKMREHIEQRFGLQATDAVQASGIAEAVEQARQAVEIMSDAERKSIVVDGVGRQIREHFDGEQTDIFHLVGRMEDYFQEAFGISIFGRGVSNDEAGMEVTDNGQVFKWFGVETSNATSGQRVILDENLPQLVDKMREHIEQRFGLASSPIGDFKKGGIDFNPSMLNLSQQGQSIGFTMNNTLLQTLQPNSVYGIQPVIINITPITNFMPLLGMADSEDEQRLSQI